MRGDGFWRGFSGDERTTMGSGGSGRFTQGEGRERTDRDGDGLRRGEMGERMRDGERRRVAGRE